MTDQLQALLDRIQNEAVTAADTRAREIEAEARQRAAALLADARQQAEATIAKAERDASALVERGSKTLEQAARDLLIAFGQRIERMVESLVAQAIGERVDHHVFERILLRLADGLAKNGVIEGPVGVLVGPADHEAFSRVVFDRLRSVLEQGIDVNLDPRLERGFQLQLHGDKVRHDFTVPAIAQALAGLVRPQLAELVVKAATGTEARPQK